MSPQGHRPEYDVVVPTLGRPSLTRLLETLAAQTGTPPASVVLVDDRPDGLPLQVPGTLRPMVLRSCGRGPAAARNLGWRVGSAPWVAFLDDDVELPPGWAEGLATDLSELGLRVGGSQGRLHVPLPPGSRPTDWERSTAALQSAAWATADMAYRRAALEEVGGFDERFPRAYREDADLAIRVRRAGWKLVLGKRVTVHPVRPAPDGISVRVQRGNADDVLMRRLHGRQWRTEGGVPGGRLPRHALSVFALVTAAGAAMLGRRSTAAGATALWAASTVEFVGHRLRPGPVPGDPRWWPEVRRMALTSVAIPPVAVGHRLRGEWRWRHGAPAWPPPLLPRRPRAILFDRDGTLVHDVPYNGDPSKVDPVDDAAEAVAAARAAGLAVGLISNQSGVARGVITLADVHGVNVELERAVGRFDTRQICPHGPDDGCACRKPAPGMVLAAARELGVRAQDCVVIGDIGADVDAARAAGAAAVLVPTAVTRDEEVASAPVVASTLLDAVRLVVRP